MVPSDDAVLPPIRATTGWMLFGLCAALLFYGVMLCQARWYFRTYPDDSVDLKVAVAAILFANAVNLGLILHYCYYYAALKTLDPGPFGYATLSIVFTPFCIFLCIILCEYVYMRRTFFIMPNLRWRWIFASFAVLLLGSATIFIIVEYQSSIPFCQPCLELTAAHCSRCILLTVQLAKQPTFTRWLKLRWLVSVSLGCSVVGDLVLACILSLALHFNRTGLKRTDRLLNSIIINAFRSGIFTSMLSIVCLLVTVFEGKNLVDLPLSIALAKVYASATLVTLNIRRNLSEILAPPGESDLLAGSLVLFRCAPLQSERQEADAQRSRSGRM